MALLIECRTMSKYHDKKYLALFNSTLGIEGKSVLEVGGSSSPELLYDYKPGKWTCVNLNRVAVDSFSENTKKYRPAFTAKYLDINKYESTEEYDLIYSIDSFEHINGLEYGMRVMYEALRPNGYLFTVFGPIWSCDVGHHLSLPAPEGNLYFENGVLEPWQHLSFSETSLFKYLVPRYSEQTAKRAIDFIYHSKDINRLFDHDYMEILTKSDFNPVLVLRKRKGKAPNIAGATNTREFLWILKKGRITITEKISILLRFGFSYVWDIKYKLGRETI